MPESLATIAGRLDTDKTQSPGYIENYQRHFGHLRGDPVRRLELGVFHGGSMLMWHEYFTKGLIVGLDLNPNPLGVMPERARFYQGSQDDEALLHRIAKEAAPEGFDIIIDDAAHLGALSRTSFNALFERHLKPGGVYVVEDWGTGYWGAWPDGREYSPASRGETSDSIAARVTRRLGLAGSSAGAGPIVDPVFASHNFGMVGFIKELVDEVAWPDITATGRGNDALPRRKSSISALTLYSGQAFLLKAR